jgi:hypothetical protein
MVAAAPGFVRMDRIVTAALARRAREHALNCMVAAP